jgi:beta-lactamase regulating signal transducer with metallopeptidase domain
VPTETLLLLSVVKATLLVGAALLLVSCLRRASAALRHAILFAAVVGSLLLPILTLTLPTFTPAPVAHVLSSNAGSHRWSDDVVRLVMARDDIVSTLPIRPSVRDTAERSSATILTIWFAGTVFVLMRIVFDLGAAYRSRRRATHRARLRGGIALLESTEVGAPVVVGIVHPAIMLPTGTPLDADALRPIITHELAHVERRDCLTQLIARMACALYWFHPMVWFAVQRMALEREVACDDHAIASGADPIEYSELLIDVARMNAHVPVRLHAASLMNAAHLEKRIVRILDASTQRGGMSRRCVVALAVAAGSVLVPLAALGVHDAPTLADRSDVYFDPQSERLPGVRAFDPVAAPVDPTTPDGALIIALRDAAAREPQASVDLVSDRARWALSMVRDGNLIEPLIAALQDPDWRVRSYAAWALSTSGDARAVEPLLPLLDHPVWRVRAMAASALRSIGDPRATPALEKALDDPAWQVRMEAVAFLGGAPAFRARIEPLRNDPHIAVRIAADEALHPMK